MAYAAPTALNPPVALVEATVLSKQTDQAHFCV